MLAVIAIAALVVTPWLAVAAALTLLALAAVDGFTVRQAPALTRSVPPVLSRGVAAPLKIDVTASDGRRVLTRQPATPALEVNAGLLTPLRRGRHELPPVASASVGPLGLLTVHHPLGPPETVRVYPDLVLANALLTRLRRGLAGHPGRVVRGPLGLGTDFESVRDYTPDDDIRQLNWRATARMGRPMSNQYRLERDRDVVCLLDAGRLMATMLDPALDATAVLALAADELGDRCGAIAFDRAVRAQVAPRHMGGRKVIETLFDLQPTAVDSDFELAFTRVGRSRRATVIVFTDLIDTAAARSLLDGVPMLARRHAVLIASVADEQLERLAAGADEPRRIVARDVLATRAAAAARLGRTGATVIEAPPRQLAERCLDAYLRAKTRAQ